METEPAPDKDKEALRLQWEAVREKIARLEATRKSSFRAAMFFGIVGGLAGGFHAHDLGYRSPLAIGGVALAAGWPAFWLIYTRMQKSRWWLLREEKALRFRLTGEDRRSDDDYMNPLVLSLLLIASIIFSILVLFVVAVDP